MTHSYLKTRLKNYVVSFLLITSLFAICLPFAMAQEPQGNSKGLLPPPSLPDFLRKELEACNPQAMYEAERLEQQADQFYRDSQYASASAQAAQYEADSATYAANDRLRDAQYYTNENEPFWRKEAIKFLPGSPDRAECEAKIANATQRAKENTDLAETFKAKAKAKTTEAREKLSEAER